MGAPIETKGTVSVEEWALEFEEAAPMEILRAAIERIPRLTLACSFGVEDMALLDMVSKVDPTVPVFYLNTDVLFKETYALRDEALERYRPHLIEVRPELTLNEQSAMYGDRLWERDPDACCDLRKVRPLEKALRDWSGWITGIRREQSPTRSNTQVFEDDRRFGLIKVNPLALWTEGQVWDYIHVHQVPYNPLHDRGYPSIGCLHCTKSVPPGADPRSGRWSGFVKTECGLHR
ncbi:MAG: phosphoadenylyl-sulfate reductase [Bacilli bacterium]